MTLTEQNLESVILSKIEKPDDWLQLYPILKNEIDSMEYSHLQYAYELYFCYYMVKHKVEISTFSTILQKIYNDMEEYRLGIFFESFFYSKDKGIELNKYCLLDKYNNTEHITDNISYLFLNLSLTENGAYHLKFDQETLPYLEQLLINLPENKMNALWSGRFQYFIQPFINNIKEIKPILDLALNHTSFNNNNLFILHLLKMFGHSLYDRAHQKQKNKQLYQDLSHLIPNFETILLESLLQTNSSNVNNIKYDIDLDILNFYMQCEQFEKAIIALNYHYQAVSQKENIPPPQIKRNRSVFYSSVMATFVHHPEFIFNYEHVDISKPIKENLIYLALFELKSEYFDSDEHEFNFDVVKYFLNQLEVKSNDLYEDISLYVETDFVPKLKKYFIYKSHQELDEKLPTNDTIIKKIKI